MDSLNANYVRQHNIYNVKFLFLALPASKIFKYKTQTQETSPMEAIKNIFLYVIMKTEFSKNKNKDDNNEKSTDFTSSSDNKPDKKIRVSTYYLNTICDIISSFDNKFGLAESDTEALFQFDERLRSVLKYVLGKFLRNDSLKFIPTSYSREKKIFLNNLFSYFYNPKRSSSSLSLFGPL